MNTFFSIRQQILSILLLVIILNINLLAQTTFITEADITLNELTPSQSDKYQKILNQETVVSTKLVNISDLSTVQQNGWLTLKMPDKECIAEIKAKYVSSYENGDFYWYGEVIKDEVGTEKDCQCYEGFINLMRNEGELIGAISIDEDRYEIQSIGEGKTILVKKDISTLNLKCGNDNSEGLLDIDQDNASSRNDGNCPVRVLALFTPNGNAAVPNIRNTINLSIAQTNQALRNSNIFECDLELILMDIQEIAPVENSNISIDINSALDLNAIIDDPIFQALRVNANADIVVVYTDGNYGSTLGRAGTLTLQEERAFCLVEAAEATTEFLTSHEIAHLFGCRHQPEADPTGPFEHAHDFKTGCWPFRTERVTIMFSPIGGGTIQHYSNPNVKFKKKKTGVTGIKENWMQLKNNACIIANFTDDDVIPILNANIAGDGYSCPCFGVGFSAQVNGGAPGPYQFEWRTSSDGFNWGTVQSTISSFSLVLPCEIGEGVYVRLTVTSSDGQINDTFRFIEATESWPGQQGICAKNSHNGDKEINTVQSNDIKVYPNPAFHILTIELANNNSENRQISIMDTYGRLVLNQLTNVVGIPSTIKVSIDQLPVGLYFVKIDNEKSIKFVKTVGY